MKEPLSKGILIYGGSRGVGRIIAELLASRGYFVTSVARTLPSTSNPDITDKTIDFSKADGISYNRELLLARPGINNFIFNIGGSFGIHDPTPSAGEFELLFRLNIGYIADTLNFLNTNNRLKNALLVFMLSNAIKHRSGNLPYRVLKLALDEYAMSLEERYSASQLKVLRFYPPLILYDDRYLPRKFFEIKSEEGRRKFIVNELNGQSPIPPKRLATEVVDRIIEHMSTPPSSNL